MVHTSKPNQNELLYRTKFVICRPLHIILTVAWHLTNRCTICCMLPLLQVLPCTKKKWFIIREVTDCGTLVAEHPSYVFISIIFFCVVLFYFYYTPVNFCTCNMLDNLRVLCFCHIYNSCLTTVFCMYFKDSSAQQFYSLCSSDSVVTSIKVNSKENFHVTAMLMFYIVWYVYLNSSCISFKVYYQALFQGPQVSGARGISASYIT
jgi:hypothetical protein